MPPASSGSSREPRVLRNTRNAVANSAEPPTTTDVRRNHETGPVRSSGGVAGVVPASELGEAEAEGVRVEVGVGVAVGEGLGVAVGTTVCSTAMRTSALAGLRPEVPAKESVRVRVPAG